MARRALRVDDGVDLPRTLRALAFGPRDPSTRNTAAGTWKATRTPDGPATVHIRIVPPGVEADAWGPGAEALLERLPGLVGQRDDASGFDPSAHRLVVDLAKQHSGLRLARTDAIAETLTPVIFGQKVIGREAKDSYRKLVYRFGEPAPGPAESKLWLPPPPRELARLGSADFHALGVERKRGDVVRRVARLASSLDRLADEPPEVVRTKLESIPGVGPWTTAKVAAAALGDPDAVPVGDHNIPHRVAWLLAGERRADDARMLELLEPFAGHRQRVLRLLGTTGASPPRRGPKLPYRNIARH